MSGDQLRMLDELLDVDEGLTAREIDFIESLNQKRGHELSTKQEKWLGDIFERICR